jgi:hypothetical protein
MECLIETLVSICMYWFLIILENVLAIYISYWMKHWTLGILWSKSVPNYGMTCNERIRWWGYELKGASVATPFLCLDLIRQRLRSWFCPAATEIRIAGCIWVISGHYSVLPSIPQCSCNHYLAATCHTSHARQRNSSHTFLQYVFWYFGCFIVIHLFQMSVVV